MKVHRAVAIRFGVVRLVVCATYTLGGLGGMLPRKDFEMYMAEIASEAIFGPVQCFSEARRQSFT